MPWNKYCGLKMKHSRIGLILVLAIILSLLIPLLTTPALAASHLSVYPREGKIGDKFTGSGSGFLKNGVVLIYLSSQEVEPGDEIDEDITAYQQLTTAVTDDSGNFTQHYGFTLPDALTQGEDKEDVHDGDYYIYAVNAGSRYVEAITTISIINGSISLDIEEGTVGTEVEVSGQELRPNQSIAIIYDEDFIDITGGDSQTDDNGDFACTVIIPPSAAGDHIISALDESGDTPEAIFTIKPKITIEPAEQHTGEAVQVSGSGFGNRQVITFILDDKEVETSPLLLTTDHYGSFESSFIVPAYGGYGAKELEVRDDLNNKATTQMTIWGGIDLSPATTPASPGYVGMELTVRGAGFSVGAAVTISYDNNGEEILIDTLTAPDGAFRTEFIVPPGPAGSHNVIASDGTSTATAVFTMESQPPLSPAPLIPEVAGTSQAAAYFDWSDVSDDSGLSYNLQVALDADFNAIVLDKSGIEASEYTLTEEEKLEADGKEDYYWRVKAVDGALNESQWTHPRLFYIGPGLAALPVWLWYIVGGIGIIVVGTLGFWLRGRKA
jgi:hypothetical protein